MSVAFKQCGLFMKITVDTIIEILQQKSLRVTKSRLSVATILINCHESYLTPEEVFKKISKDALLGCDQASVYRTLATFEKIGVVHKSDFHKDAARYKINERFGEKKSHKHFFKCIECSTVEPFSDCFISKKEKELEDFGYKNLKHHIEITGLCPSCAM